MKRIYKYTSLGIIAIVAAIVGALLAHVVLESKRQGPTLTFGTLLDVPRPLPKFELLDQDGNAFDLSRLHNRWTVMFFGFTNCGDVCPTTLTMLAAMNKSLTDLPSPKQPQIVFVSVDTKRDTPETVKAYVKNFDASFIGVTGAQSQIDSLTGALGVPSQVTVNANGNVTVDHSSAILVITPQGEFRALFSSPQTVQALVADYRRARWCKSMSRSGDTAFMLLQRVLPKHALSHLVYRVMRSERPGLRDRLLRFFLNNYRVQMEEAIETDPFAYASFNAFFTRALKTTARPIDHSPNALVSPVDGTVSQCGHIDADTILQAKGQDYSLAELLGDELLAAKYRGGSFACIYLAPYNYHRIHMPLAGVVQNALYIPGDLFSVNAATARSVPRLFARNERVVCDFKTDTATGLACFSMTFVGALFVGSMETIWGGEVNPPPRLFKQPVPMMQGIGTALSKGAEAGRFNMGSTVVLVFPPNTVEFDAAFAASAIVKMGQRIGKVMGER